MPQIRIMDDDAEYVDHILAILLPLLASEPRLIASTVTRLNHRGGGGRKVLTLLAVDYPPEASRPIRVDAERVYQDPPPRRAGPRPRRLGELPPAG